MKQTIFLLPGTSLGPLMVANGPLPYLTWQGSALLDTTAISSNSCPPSDPMPPPPPPPPLPCVVTSLPMELSCDCFLPPPPPLRQLSTSRFAVDITPSPASRRASRWCGEAAATWTSRLRWWRKLVMGYDAWSW